MSVSGVDTGAFKELTITIIDPCTTAILTIDDSVFLTPLVTLTQFINYPSETISWTDAIVSSSYGGPDVCGPYIHELYDRTTGTAPEPNVFTPQDLNAPVKILHVSAAYTSLVAMYDL